jgi:hypothetical protein
LILERMIRISSRACYRKELAMRNSRLMGLVLMVLLVLASAGLVVAGSNGNFQAHLRGRDEVPLRETRAQGQTILRLSDDGTELYYKLIVANIENVVAAHIHLGPEGANGPIVAFLYGSVAPGGGRTDGVLAEGTLTAANLIGPLAGEPLSSLVTALETGGAYVNVHTNDGVAPTNTGPGDFPGGEVRGQVR